MAYICILLLCPKCFMPFCNTPCQYTPLLHLWPLISTSKPCGCLCCITLTPTHSIISYENIVFHLCLFQAHLQDYELWLVALPYLSVCLSACPSAWNNSASIGQFYMTFDISAFFENLPRKLKFHQNLTRIMGVIHEDLCKFMGSH